MTGDLGGPNHQTLLAPQSHSQDKARSVTFGSSISLDDEKGLVNLRHTTTVPKQSDSYSISSRIKPTGFTNQPNQQEKSTVGNLVDLTTDKTVALEDAGTGVYTEDKDLITFSDVDLFQLENTGSLPLVQYHLFNLVLTKSI